MHSKILVYELHFYYNIYITNTKCMYAPSDVKPLSLLLCSIVCDVRCAMYLATPIPLFLSLVHLPFWHKEAKLRSQLPIPPPSQTHIEDRTTKHTPVHLNHAIYTLRQHTHTIRHTYDVWEIHGRSTEIYTPDPITCKHTAGALRHG